MSVCFALKFIAQLNSATGEVEIMKLIRTLADQMEFDYFRLFLFSPCTIQRPKVKIFNGCPVEWVDIYSKKKFLQVDPLIRRGMIQTMPLLWANVITECCDQQDEAGLNVMLSAQAAGLEDGVTLPWHGVRGHVGLLSMMTKGLRSEEKWLFHQPLLLWLSMYIFEALSRIDLANESGRSILSFRELEVCQWAAEGKQVNDIALILNISPRTVTFHLNRVKDKLGASSKCQAISWGIKKGLINLNIKSARVFNVNE